MPFKSQAQRRKFAQLLVEGKISPETFEEWNRETGAAKLPERASSGRKPAVKKSAKKAPKAGRKATARKATGKRTRSTTSRKRSTRRAKTAST